MASSDPVVIELNRLENHLREKERELGVAQCEIKALKVTKLLKDKAVLELNNELKKLEVKLRTSEKHLEDKNLEIKKLSNEKKEALAAQYAAEATLRRVHATQQDEESLPFEAIIAPYKSDIKMYKNEIVTLQEDKKALERLTKAKEAALVEVERTLCGAQERAMIVEVVQNQNLELKRQIEICQEENRLLEKANRQKVVEVEKLTQTIHDLEESLLAGGVAANVVRDYRRQISELNEEKRTLERELARVKVSANRVAMVVANEWKDESEKVMPVRQWLEDRKFLQGEIQQLRDKLAVAERTANAEAQLKEKLKLRLKILEEGLKEASSLSTRQAESPKKLVCMSSPNGTPRKRSMSQPRASVFANKISTSILQQPISAIKAFESTKNIIRTNSLKSKFITGENLVRKNLWAPRSKFLDDNGKENTVRKDNGHVDNYEVAKGVKVNGCGDVELQNNCDLEGDHEDTVSGFLYDKLQKEVINLRKLHEERDRILNAKDDEIKLLQRKVDALTKAMEVESKKMKREAAAREKEQFPKLEDKQKCKVTNISKRYMRHQQSSTSIGT